MQGGRLTGELASTWRSGLAQRKNEVTVSLFPFFCCLVFSHESASPLVGTLLLGDHCVKSPTRFPPPLASASPGPLPSPRRNPELIDPSHGVPVLPSLLAIPCSQWLDFVEERVAPPHPKWIPHPVALLPLEPISKYPSILYPPQASACSME